MADSTHLVLALSSAATYIKSKGVELPSEFYAKLDAFKTKDFYTRAIRRDVLDYYRGDMGADEFVDDMIRLVEGQLTRAWNEGMRLNGLDPTKDMLEEYEAQLQDLIANEFTHIEDFAAVIEKARAEQTGVESLYSRSDLWVERYDDVKNQSVLATAIKGDVLEWVMGATEEHCDTCARLDGIVATAEEWEASGYKPQSPPNPALECGGWRCQCALVPTDKKPTEGGIPSV